MSGISHLLEIINFITIFQLLFFGLYLFIKGNRIYSTFFLKIHLFFQLISYIIYFFWTNDSPLIRPFLPLSMSGIFLWAPTFYFYIRSRLYVQFVPSKRLLVHGIPAIIMALIVIYYLIRGNDFRDKMSNIGSIALYLSKIQQILYYTVTIYIIYKYRNDLKSVTSASEQKELNWLLLITYGIVITTYSSFLIYALPGISNDGFRFSYFSYFIFINVFFFKAILQPDQFLGIDKRKLSPVRLSKDKCKDHFKRIEELINSKQLFLDPELNLHNIAQATKLSDRMVSQVIKQNQSLYFNDYINSKRIDYAKEVLRRTTKAQKNVLEILYEAGFNSKSVFNTQFKKHTGISPSEFRERNSVYNEIA